MSGVVLMYSPDRVSRLSWNSPRRLDCQGFTFLCPSSSGYRPMHHVLEMKLRVKTCMAGSLGPLPTNISHQPWCVCCGAGGLLV